MGLRQKFADSLNYLDHNIRRSFIFQQIYSKFRKKQRRVGNALKRSYQIELNTNSPELSILFESEIRLQPDNALSHDQKVLGSQWNPALDR